MIRDDVAKPVSRSPINPLPYLFAKHFAEGTVVRADTIGRQWRAIRIHCSEMARLNYTPGQHIRVELRDPFSMYGILRPIETMRTYSIWHWDESGQSFDLRVHLREGDGIGLQWARDVRTGDVVRFWGPQGDFLPKQVGYHLFLGDETALAAFGAMMRVQAAGQQRAILEVDTPHERLPLPPTAMVRWLFRNGKPAVASDRLLRALSQTELPQADAAAYVAGEARTCQMIRDHLIQRGWRRSHVQVKPFWAFGKRGLH